MAAKFVVGLAIIALCHSSPVLVNEIRDGRSLSIAEGSATGYGSSENRVSAKVHGNVAHATGTTNGGIARDGQYYTNQGQVFAKAQTYDHVDQAAIDIARAQGFYHPLHVAQPAVITYNQNVVPAEQFVYQPLAAAPSAESVATTNGAYESSLSTATNGGSGGVAESNAQTQGNYGLTTTNAKTVGDYNTAASNANSGLGHATANSKASGSGIGSGYASSKAQTNGAFGVAPIPAVPEAIAQPAIIAGKNQGFYNPALYGSASSKANVHGYGSADASAKTGAGPARRSIRWHFGTAYDIPAGYGSVKAAPVVYQPAPVVYRAVPAEVSPYGNAKTAAKSKGAGSALASANLNAGNGNVHSNANSQLGGSADSTADINNNAYGFYRSGAVGSGVAKTSAISNERAWADSNASLNQGVDTARSTANSNGGYANAKADINNYNYGLYRTAGEGAWGRTVSNAQATGLANAQSNAQRHHSGLKSADATAKSNGWGSAIADSQSL